MKRLDIRLATPSKTEIRDRLAGLRVAFESNRHRYASRRLAMLGELFLLVETEHHLNALQEALASALPSLDTLAPDATEYYRAMAA